MTLQERIDAFVQLGIQLKQYNAELEDIIESEQNYNPWFTPYFIRCAINALSEMLVSDNLYQWIDKYKSMITIHQSSKVGVILAGNIPMVGFHDFLSVLLVGDVFVGKLSSKDNHLLPALSAMLIKINADFEPYIQFTEDKLGKVNKIIATGGSAASQYFSYYFKTIPSIIRSHCNSVALLNGKESVQELKALADDIMLYFGLGCRSISKLYVPENYDFTPLFQIIDSYQTTIGMHHKYLNNLEYQKTIHLLDRIPFLDQGLLVVKSSQELSSPIAVLHYEYYKDIEQCSKQIKAIGEALQCAVSNAIDDKFFLPLGSAQSPKPWQYANNIDTINFLLKK